MSIVAGVLDFHLLPHAEDDRRSEQVFIRHGMMFMVKNRDERVKAFLVIAI